MTIGCCMTHASTATANAVLNGSASPVAIRPPQKNAAAKSHGCSRSRRSRYQRIRRGTSASRLEASSAPKNTTDTSARIPDEQAQLDERGDAEQAREHRREHEAGPTPAERRAEEQRVVVAVREERHGGIVRGCGPSK